MRVVVVGVFKRTWHLSLSVVRLANRREAAGLNAGLGIGAVASAQANKGSFLQYGWYPWRPTCCSTSYEPPSIRFAAVGEHDLYNNRSCSTTYDESCLHSKFDRHGAGGQ